MAKKKAAKKKRSNVAGPYERGCSPFPGPRRMEVTVMAQEEEGGQEEEEVVR